MELQFRLLTILSALGFMGVCSGAPTKPSPELTALVDRAAIEDFFNDYYSQFGPKSKHDFMAYFADDGRLEVNGLVANSREEIEAMYTQASVGGKEEAPQAEGVVPEGVSEMMFTNLKIDLQGGKTVATLFNRKSLEGSPQHEMSFKTVPAFKGLQQVEYFGIPDVQLGTLRQSLRCVVVPRLE